MEVTLVNFLWFAGGVVVTCLLGGLVTLKYVRKWMAEVKAEAEAAVEERSNRLIATAVGSQAKQIEAEILKRKSQIEIEAVKMVVEKTEEARLTRKPVTIEFAGITETFEIQPPTVFGILRNNLRT